MSYTYAKNVRDNAVLRASFNELTRQTFGFDFTQWYAAGHWGDLYIPHVLTEGDRVVSNVSVNLMEFQVGAEKKNYIQLGTVMTTADHRGQGLNRRIMEQILEEYAGKVDGIYLFGNDSVLDYYPKFGFHPAREYEYYMTCQDLQQVTPYAAVKIDMTQDTKSRKLYESICKAAQEADTCNANDAFYMCANLGLYQFWMANGFGDGVYYLPETENYAVAERNENVLYIHQFFGKQQVDILRLARTFGEDIREVVLGYTPVEKAQFAVREYQEEDCTLFILGEDLQRVEQEKLRFPVLSHA